MGIANQLGIKTKRLTPCEHGKQLFKLKRFNYETEVYDVVGLEDV